MSIYRLQKSSSKDYIEEGFIISENDIQINIDKWNDSNNVLLITGLSGSGKSTLASELAKKHNATIIPMDSIEQGKNTIIYNELCKRLSFYSDWKNLRNNVYDEEYTSYLTKIFKTSLNIISELKGMYILEGIQLIAVYESIKLFNKPMIIKNTSALKSLYRAYTREIESAKSASEKKEIYSHYLKSIIDNIRDYYDAETKKKKLIKKVSNENHKYIISDDKKQDHIEDFEKNTGIEVIDSEKEIDNLSELEDEFEDFNQMTYKQRKVSNAKSEELFGKNNIDRYNDIKSKLLKTNKNTDNNIVVHAEDGNVIVIDEPEDDKEIPDYDNKIEIAKDWSKQSMIFIMVPQNTIAELESLWNKWNMMHLKHRRDSDNKSNELFGMNNQDHYEQLKSDYLKRGEGIINNDEAIPTSDYITTNEGLIKSLESKIIQEMNSNNKLSILPLLEDINSLQDTTVYDDIMINNIVNKTKEYLTKESTILDKVTDFPYFTPNELEDKGVFKEEFYNTKADNKYLDKEEKITTKKWFESYKLLMSGFILNERQQYTSMWIDKLNNLYSDFEYIKENGTDEQIRARKQSILELGWNPEIGFNIKTRQKVNNKISTYIKENCLCKSVDVQEIYESSSNKLVFSESDNEKKIYPLYTVLTYTGSPFAKAVRRVTNAVYSHSSIGLDAKLDRLYSYDILENGFSLESIDRYAYSNKSTDIVVYVTFLTKQQILKVKSKLDYFLANKNNTRYSLLNIIGIGLGKDVEKNHNMICSQFVDRILKMVNMDITNKPSGLVAPNDFYISRNNNMYKLFEGKVTDYDAKKAQNTVNYLIDNQQQDLLKESSLVANEQMQDILKIYSDIYYIKEAKEFPVQFDEEGNLLIKNMKSLDFEAEYAKSHKLLLVYEKSNNIEGMKYELSKLWFMNTIIEQKIYSKKINDNEKQELHKVRARILNDFNKYLKLVSENDKEFNFTSYYNDTPFSDSTVKINSSTLKHGGKILKSLGKLMV